ncbi:MAG: flagellin, partial [Dehalococcoidales bacterium]|nr:flagellin [Dehalococcoidales bacterium]
MATGDFTRINTNIGALNALNALKDVQSKLGVSQLRLATGKRINQAADDPAGLTIATKFGYRSSGLGQALANIGDAKNMMAVAEGGLQKINDILTQMRDKATQAASDTLGSSERGAIKAQLAQFTSEIDAIVGNTTWNGNKLLDGLSSIGGTVTFQTGADTDSSNQISLTSSGFTAMDSNTLSINSLSVSSSASALASITSLSSAISAVSSNLQTVGALVSRLDFREETVTVAKVNTDAAYSRIMDADMANEQLNATKYQILQQTAT